MQIRFYIDVDTRLPHFYDHGVTESEVHDILKKPLEEFRGRHSSYIALGQTRSGRYLKVIYSQDDDGQGIFVITAYDLPAKQLRSLRRRLRRRPR